MKKALVTLLDDGFFIGLECFMKSLLKTNPWFDLDFIILDNGLSQKIKTKILKIYKKTKFVPIQKQYYTSVKFGRTAKRLQATYYTFDLFIQTGYDRLVFIDMDTLVMGDIRELWDCEGDFVGCKAYDRRHDRLIDTINSGVFSVGKKHINSGMYKRLIAMSANGHSMPDQVVLNTMFKNDLTYFNKSYNVEKRMLGTKNFAHIMDKIRILHFVGAKPWENPKPSKSEEAYGPLEKLWEDCYNDR